MSNVRVGDIVITPKGDFALAMTRSATGRLGVQFVQNGPLRFYDPTSLRRASLEDIERSPLAGVGCNQSVDLF